MFISNHEPRKSPDERDSVADVKDLRRRQRNKFRRDLEIVRRNALERARHEQEARAREVLRDLSKMKKTPARVISVAVPPASNRLVTADHTSGNSVHATHVERCWTEALGTDGIAQSIRDMMVVLAEVSKLLYPRSHPRRKVGQEPVQYEIALRVFLVRHVIPRARALLRPSEHDGARARGRNISTSRDLARALMRCYVDPRKEPMTFERFLTFE